MGRMRRVAKGGEGADPVGGQGIRIGREVNLRFARTLGTAEVLAIGAFSRFADKRCVASMACSADAMDRRLPHDFVAGGHLWHHKELRFRPQARIWCRVNGNRGCRLRRCGLGLGLPLLGRLAGEARTFLAAGVRAVVAYFLGAESDLAAMALSMDAHSDSLLHSPSIAFPYRCPFTRLECQTPFCKQSTGLFFLVLVVGGSGGDGSRGNGELGGLGGGFLLLRRCGLGRLGSRRARCGGALGRSQIRSTSDGASV